MTSAVLDHENMALPEDNRDAFADLVQVLYGDGAYETIEKFSPGGSELHAGGNKKKSAKREKAAYRAGLAGNAIATVGGAHALGMSLEHESLPGSKYVRKVTGSLKKVPGATKVGEAVTSPKGKAAAAVGAGAWVGLHSAELASDVYANHAIRRNHKRNLADLGKSFTVPPDPRKRLVDADTQGIPMPMGGQLVRMAANEGPAALQHSKKGAQATAAVTVPAAKKVRRTLKDKIFKADDTFEVTWDCEISKVDTDKRQVFGWASVVEKDGQPVVDLQGDYISPAEMEKAAYSYVQKSRKGGDMHERDGEGPRHVSDMIESFIVTPEKIEKMGLPAGSLPIGWWTGWQVHDEDTWQLIKSGKRPGLSIHGRGRRTPVDD